MVSQEFLEKFKNLYKEKFNIILTDEEATKLATDFLNLMRVLIRPKQNSNIASTERGNK
jgi:hypothetical protein